MPPSEPHGERNNNIEFSSFDILESGPVTTAAGNSLSPVAKICILLTPKVLKVIIVVLATAVIVGSSVIIIIIVTHFTAPELKAPATATTPKDILNVSSSSSSSTTTTTAATALTTTTLSSTTSSSTKSPPVLSSTKLPTTTQTTTSSTTWTTTSSSSSTTWTTTSSATSTTMSSSSLNTSTATLQTTTTLPANTTTTVKPVCTDSTKMMCGSGECISWSQLCDGLPNCKDGSDEGVGCACGSDQWTCASGQCIPADARCNKVTDCMDSSDEVLCPDCSGFQCDSGLCLWDFYLAKCNGIFDCNDLSDEMDCTARQGPMQCQNGVRVPQTQWCDGIDDCGDNSDEIKCLHGCPAARVACADGRCIRRTWLCDGHHDCENGTDENNCGSCLPTQLMCDDYRCVNETSVCDGTWDCRTGEDERHCFSLQDDTSGVLFARFLGKDLPICADTWSADFAVQICADINQLQLVEWNQVKAMSSSSSSSSSTSSQFAAFRLADGKALTSNLFTKESCDSGHIVSITCSQEECGVRQVPFLQSLVAGGQVVSPGKWPWVVSLLFLGRHICGGTLINSRWIVTAAHCILHGVKGGYDLTTTSHNFEVVVGSTHILGQSHVGTPYRIRADRVVLYTNLTQAAVYQGVDWDMALVRMSVPVGYTKYIQPACLPHQRQTMPTNTLCYATGWGMISSLQAVRPENLRDTRMQLWSDERCARNVVAGEVTVNTNSTLCGGYFDGLPSTCQGDSGGPLICQSPSGRWMLAGVTSQGNSMCGVYNPKLLANRFTRIANVADWIQQTIQET